MPNLIDERQRGRVRRLVLNRPEKLNAMNSDMQREFFSAIDRAMEDDEIGVVVISGAGRAGGEHAARLGN